jgi:hypothetical protein
MLRRRDNECAADVGVCDGNPDRLTPGRCLKQTTGSVPATVSPRKPIENPPPLAR